MGRKTRVGGRGADLRDVDRAASESGQNEPVCERSMACKS